MAIRIEDINKTRTNKKADKKPNGFLKLMQYDISFSKGLNGKKKHWFFGEMGMLLQSGVDIKNALDLIVEEQKEEKQAAFYKHLRKEVFAGESLSKTMEASGEFKAYDYFSVQIGEESGNLDKVLIQLGEFYEKNGKLQRQLMSSLTYPIMVLGVAIAAVLFMMNFLVPMFEDIFKRFSGGLPFITQKIINISHSLSDNFLLVLLILISIIVVIYLVHNTLVYRKNISWLQLHIPIMKEVVLKNHLARFCQSLGMLIEAKVPLTEALRLVKDMTVFYPIQKAIPEIITAIEKGDTLHGCLKKYSIFDNRMVFLIKIGEEINQLSPTLNKLQVQLSADVEMKVSVLSSLLEPFLIIIVGILVGIIMVAMYLPLFQISNTFM